MIRAYDDYGNIVCCAECRFYDKKNKECLNERNEYRGSGGEYCFSIDCVGIHQPILTVEECDNWFCADFEEKVCEK